jgi:hypothetical protein
MKEYSRKMEGTIVAKPTKRKRAIAKTMDGVGGARYLLYREAWKRIADSYQQGYYLEAITLLESVISDRLESVGSHLSGRDWSFLTLGQLVANFRRLERAQKFKEVIEEIDGWRERRNQSLHEMVKFQNGERPTWEQKLHPFPGIAKEGAALLRRFDAIDVEQRRRQGARPSATEPHAFAEELISRK